MTLLTEHLEAGWREVESGTFGKWVAERVHARPGATSTVIRVEAATSPALQAAVTLRESQLAGTEEPIKDTITDDGTLVSGEQHEALRTDGVVVPGPEQEATVDADVAAKDAEIESLRAQVAEHEAALAAAQTATVPEQAKTDEPPADGQGDDLVAPPAEGEQPPASE